MRIVQVVSRRDRRRFIDLPWHIYDPALHPQWVPPLRMVVRKTLDTRRNPFYRNAEIALFLAEQGRRTLGRIAAIENRAHNRFHGDRVGFFGFFECVDDPEPAAALLDAAARWLRERGLEVMRGPVSPSTNHETGLLVRGFRHHPMILTPWNPRYYVRLMEETGMAGVKDLLGYFIPMTGDRFQLPDRFRRHAERAMKDTGIRFRDLDMRRFDRELRIAWEIYNEAWEPNWGFVPLTWEEFAYLGGDLKELLIPEFSFVAEVEGEPAGFMMIVPDFNQIFKRIPSGRLLPTGIVKILLGKRRLRTGRIMALGVRAAFRSRSIFPLFAYEAYRRGRAYGALGAEASWVLEDNERMNAPLRHLGIKVYRRWRIYERSLTGSSDRTLADGGPPTGDRDGVPADGGATPRSGPHGGDGRAARNEPERAGGP